MDRQELIDVAERWFCRGETTENIAYDLDIPLSRVLSIVIVLERLAVIIRAEAHP